jgi:hypothetical protein
MILRYKADIARNVFAAFVFAYIKANHIAFLEFVEFGFDDVGVMEEQVIGREFDEPETVFQF